jgi:hypothetical protein
MANQHTPAGNHERVIRRNNGHREFEQDNLVISERRGA